MTQEKKPFSWRLKLDPQVVTALIGLFGTFIASPIALHVINQFQLPAISDKRRQTLEGRWEGIGAQITTSAEERKRLGIKGPIFKFPAHLNLSVQSRTIKGTLEIIKVKPGSSYYHPDASKSSAEGSEFDEHKEASYSLTGNMVASNFIRLDYVSTDPAVVEFGTLLLKLPSAGGKLEGKYVSYGPITEELVNGTYTFKQSH